MVDKDNISSAEAIAKSVEKVSDSKGLAAIGEGLGWGIGALAVALIFWALTAGTKWDGRLFPEPKCFNIQEVAGRVFKVNTCTGDITEIDTHEIEEAAQDPN